MANLNYRSQFHNSYAGQMVSLLAKVSIGSSGAPTLVSGTGMGILSVTRNSAGAYTFALSNPFYSLLGVRVSIKSGSSAPAAPIMNIVTDSANVTAAPLVKIQMRDLSAVATDPASGEVLYVELMFNRSSTGN